VFTEYEPLECWACGKDVLEEGQGVIAFVRPMDVPVSERRIVDAYATCKACDRRVQRYFADKGNATSWEDLQDLINPVGFMRWIMALLNRIYAKERYPEEYSSEGIEAIKTIALKISQKVIREPTTKEIEEFLKDMWLRDNFV